MRPTGLSFLRGSILALAALLFSVGSQPAAVARDRTPRQFLQTIYAAYGSNGNGLRWRGSRTGQYFDRALTKLIENDMRESEGGVGRLEVDPFIHAQDFDISALEIDIPSEDLQRAKGVASFINLSEPTKVEFDLVNTSQGWRIANIRWSDGETLIGILSGPLAQ